MICKLSRLVKSKRTVGPKFMGGAGMKRGGGSVTHACEFGVNVEACVSSPAGLAPSVILSMSD